MSEEYIKFKTAFNAENKKARDSFLSWVRTVITIMTPSLVLLIGLQGTPQEAIQKYFLVASLVLMSLTILLGLLLLHSESVGHHKLRDQIGQKWNIEKSGHPSQIEYTHSTRIVVVKKVFSSLTPLSIMSVTIFGICKYIT